MVGVKISTSTRSGPSNALGVASARAFIAGVTERGSNLTPVSVRSIVAFESEFGTLQSYSAHMYRAAKAFFEEGGAELVVCRAVGPASTIGFHTFKDRTAVPLDTMKVEAANPGSWSSGLTIVITDGRVADSVTVSAYLAGERVVYIRDKSSIAELAAATIGNSYITITDLGAVSLYPTRLPAAITATALSAGDDKRVDLLAADVVAALNGAGSVFGAGAVACPGYYADTVGTDLIAHCKLNRRIAILAGQADDAVEDLLGSAESLTVDGEYAGLFGPWVTVPEGSSTAEVSPEGYILGVRARVMNAEGFWQAPAGNRAAARYIQGTVDTFSPADIDELADGHVSGITRFGSTTVLYGWRSLSINSDQYTLLVARDFLNALTEQVEATLQPYIFETIDGTGQLLGRIKGALVGLLQPIQDAGGVAAKYDVDGNEINPAYRVEVAVVNETTISATIVVRLSGAAETIQVSIIKAAFNATV